MNAINDRPMEGPVNSGFYSIFNKLNKSFTGPSLEVYEKCTLYYMHRYCHALTQSEGKFRPKGKVIARVCRIYEGP